MTLPPHESRLGEFMARHSTLWNELLVIDLPVADNDAMTDASSTQVSSAHAACALFADTNSTLPLLTEEDPWRATQQSPAGQ